ncbi:MAG: carboxypeptidase regulatory-like domain-containing protein [Thermoanaerobaculia bacterium]|nr:carboxypeptidase regulatory-like domain-containing protein [Thermoanaerobaculia bacterium]
MTGPDIRFRFAALCAVALMSAALLTGCGGKDDDEDRPKSARSAGASKEGAASTAAAAASAAAGPAAGAKGAASIAGRIVFEGAVPAAEKFKMSADAFCVKSHPGDVSREDIVIGKDKGLANVFVYVKSGISGTYPPPATAATIDQKGCTYSPHVFGVVAGQNVDILNSDPTLHNIHSLPEKNEPFNLAMPVQGMKYTKKFEKPEVMVRIKCDVHGWMSAYCGVLSHPFFAVTAPDGTYTIKDLPAGTYTIEAWHEKLGTQTQQVTVGAQESKPAAFTFKAGA